MIMKLFAIKTRDFKYLMYQKVCIPLTSVNHGDMIWITKEEQYRLVLNPGAGIGANGTREVIIWAPDKGPYIINFNWNTRLIVLRDLSVSEPFLNSSGWPIWEF